MTIKPVPAYGFLLQCASEDAASACVHAAACIAFLLSTVLPHQDSDVQRFESALVECHTDGLCKRSGCLRALLGCAAERRYPTHAGELLASTHGNTHGHACLQAESQTQNTSPVSAAARED